MYLITATMFECVILNHYLEFAITFMVQKLFFVNKIMNLTESLDRLNH
jgi:hypothetical protein